MSSLKMRDNRVPKNFLGKGRTALLLVSPIATLNSQSGRRRRWPSSSSKPISKRSDCFRR